MRSRWHAVEVPAGPPRRTLDRPVEEILRPAARWVLPIVSEVEALYARGHPDDDRVSAALAATRSFADGAPRSTIQRTTAIAALKAAKAATEPSLQAAARAASAAAALAYMHPDLIDANQLKHLYGPVVYTAVAFELDDDHDEAVGDRILKNAVRTATQTGRELARSMPAPPQGRTRTACLHALLDVWLRGTVAEPCATPPSRR